MTKTYPEIKAETARVFFAIWPNDPARKQFAHLAKLLESTSGGRKVSNQKFHLTLAFLGKVNINRLEALRLAAKGVTAQTFELCFEEIAYWKHNHIIYAKTVRHPPELLALVNSLRNVLSKAGFEVDERTYTPHITLVRNTTHQTAIDLIRPISWRAHEWTLVHSKQTDYGINYIPLGRWPLI